MPKPGYEAQSFQSFSSFVCYEDFLPAAQLIIMLIRPGESSISQRHFPHKDYARNLEGSTTMTDNVLHIRSINTQYLFV